MLLVAARPRLEGPDLRAGDRAACSQTHCNSVHPYQEGSGEETNTGDKGLYPPSVALNGFRVSGMGMYSEEKTCQVNAMGRKDTAGNPSGEGNFGFTIFDTTNDKFRIIYFNTNTDTLYAEALSCIKLRGWRECADDSKNAHFVSMWLDIPLNKAQATSTVPSAKASAADAADGTGTAPPALTAHHAATESPCQTSSQKQCIAICEAERSRMATATYTSCVADCGCSADGTGTGARIAD